MGFNSKPISAVSAGNKVCSNKFTFKSAFETFAGSGESRHNWAGFFEDDIALNSSIKSKDAMALIDESNIESQVFQFWSYNAWSVQESVGGLQSYNRMWKLCTRFYDE